MTVRWWIACCLTTHMNLGSAPEWHTPYNLLFPKYNSTFSVPFSSGTPSVLFLQGAFLNEYESSFRNTCLIKTEGKLLISKLFSCAIKTSLLPRHNTWDGVEQFFPNCYEEKHEALGVLDEWSWPFLMSSHPQLLYYLVLIVYTDHKIGNISWYWECTRRYYYLYGLWSGIGGGEENFFQK